MAYVSQELKQRLVAAVKKNLVKFADHNLKVSYRVDNHSTIVVTIASGNIDFGNRCQQVNHYWIPENFDGVARDVLLAIRDGLLVEHWDKSDAMTDYFDCSYYISINIGKWNKPYELV